MYKFFYSFYLSRQAKQNFLGQVINVVLAKWYETSEVVSKDPPHLHTCVVSQLVWSMSCSPIVNPDNVSLTF